MRRLVLVTAVVAVAGLVAACGSSTSDSGAAATVNGEKISNQSVVDELQAVAGNADFLAAVEEQVSVTGPTPGSFDAAFAAQVLTRQIQFTLVAQEVHRRKLSLDDECTKAARTDQYRQLGGADPVKGQELFEKFPEAYQETLVTWNAKVLVLQGDLVGEGCIAADDTVRHYFDTHQDEFVQTCASHILLDTQAEADAVEVQLQQGADFATLAQQLSKDTGSAAHGGDVGCFTGGQFVPEFETAALALDIGEISPPVQSQFGWHVIKVTDKNSPTFEEVADQVQQKLGESASAGFQMFFNDAIANAEVTVDERYGAWDAERGEVTSPDASASPSTSSTETDTGSS